MSFEWKCAREVHVVESERDPAQPLSLSPEEFSPESPPGGPEMQPWDPQHQAKHRPTNGKKEEENRVHPVGLMCVETRREC